MMQKRRLNMKNKWRNKERSKHIFLAGLFYLDYSHFFQAAFLVCFLQLIYCRVWYLQQLQFFYSLSQQQMLLKMLHL